MRNSVIIFIMLVGISVVCAKVDLAILPGRDAAQLTIYNSADLTLVRETRNLTLKKGLNNLQFSWADTLIDPTSLKMTPKKHPDKIEIDFLTYPARTKNIGVWNIRSEVAGGIPVEITYLISGLSWRAFYMGTLTPDEMHMNLSGYVRVHNGSGEEYENAQTRLIVGKVHIIDQIADLARRQYPYGSPVESLIYKGLGVDTKHYVKKELVEATILAARLDEDFAFGADLNLAKKEIKKEGLSEYFLYTIEGTETISNNWAKRLPSFDIADIPIESLYKYDEQRWGNNTIRFIAFANDEDHEMGDTPIPNGSVKVYRNTGDNNHLSYVGGTSIKYIPVDEDIELNLGPAREVKVEPVLMSYKTENHRFNKDGNIDGWDDIQTWQITVTNTRKLPIEVEIYRNFNTSYRDIKNNGDFGEYEKEDSDTAKYTLKLKPYSKQTFEYESRIYQGTRQEAWKP